jgi:hypothetical protein
MNTSAKELPSSSPSSTQPTFKGRVKGVRHGTNAVLHPWLKEELTALLATLPPPVVVSPAENRAEFERGPEGLKVRITLSCPVAAAAPAAESQITWRATLHPS